MKIRILLMLLAAGIAGCAVRKNTQTIHPFSGESIGCSNFIIYQLSVDQKQYIAVKLDASSIEWQGSQAYTIGKADILSVQLRTFDGAVSQMLCNDVNLTTRPKKLSEEVAKEGVVEVMISREEIDKASNNRGYKASVVLKNVIFDSLRIDYLKIDNVYVGWLPG